MPKRPRSHQLEDESRNAFCTVLPSEWVFRKPTPDYGVDGEVEIFDDQGNTTGRTFLVQLKSTDEARLTRALSISFPLETCKYYRTLDRPLLVVLYHAPRKEIYVKWFHTHDLYYTKGGRKTTTFRLSDTDRWDSRSPQKLRSDIERIRQIDSPFINLPISLRLIIMEPTVHGIPGTLVDSAIRKETADLRSIVRITQLQCADQLGSISVDNRKIVVSLADKYSFTFHTSQGYEPTTSPWKLACDVLMAVAVAVHTAGHFPIAARLFGRYADKSSLTSNSVVLARMAHCMAHAGHVIQGLQIAEALSENRETYVEALLLMCALRRQQAAFSDTECQHLQRFLENQVRIAEKSGDRGRLATAHYNLGRHLCMSQVLSAFRHYKKAARLDPDYVDRHYFCAEIGGMLFDTGHYVISAKWYERALNLGAEANCRALYADALLFAGKYRESEENFKAYLESTADLAAEWRLKAFVVGGIRRMLNVEGQTRQRQHALKIVGSISHLEGTEKQRALEDALRLDALCQLAWFNLGVLSNEEKDQEDALLCFLVAALLRKSDIEAWCNACVLWFSTKTPSAFLQACTIEAAYEATGEAFIEQMQRVVDKQSTDFPRLEVMEALNKAVATLPRRPTPFHVRLLGEGSSVEIIRL